MKKLFLSLTLLLGSWHAYSQQDYYQNPEIAEERKMSVTVGFLQGGGSLIGADLEALLTKQVGAQVGLGLFGYGAGLNYHFKPSIRSSFISMQYWHQGIGDGYVQSMLGPTVVYRSKKWFTAQLGLGKTMGSGPAFPADRTLPPAMLLYSIGAYFPL